MRTSRKRDKGGAGIIGHIDRNLHDAAFFQFHSHRLAVAEPATYEADLFGDTARDLQVRRAQLTL